jgi:ATP adenylyltransferase
MKFLKLSIKVLSKKYSPEGFNIGVNLGKVAGAGIDDHIHFHLVPRWMGDTNFMPVLGDTKIISQNLQETWKIIKEGFDEIKIGELL